MNESSFERPDQIREYVEAFRSRFLPLKFAYIGPAAHTHDELVRSKEYGIADIEAKLIRSKLASIIPPELKNSNVNIIDIGSGNGLKAITVIKVLVENGTTPFYFALDYSSELATIALKNVTIDMPSLIAKTNIIDFELSPFRDVISDIERQFNYPNLFLTLGHTLGNPVHRDTALLNISKSMGHGSYLLTAVELYQSTQIDRILDHYRNEPFYRAVFNPLTFGGISWDDGQLDVRFNESTRNVEVHFQFAREFSLESNSGESILFHRGDQLLIFISHRFEISELDVLFSQSGLRIQQIVFDDDKSYALLLSLR